ncbi:hypothetical protein CcrBL47_gp324 [Caulobacter phage BL47]|nr:hypothetical protein CcrBL47_gp324 [Caulobacter phage BL47]
MQPNASNVRNALILLKEEDPNLAHLLDPVINDRGSLSTLAEILTKTYEAGYNRPTLTSYEVTGHRTGIFPLDMLRRGECWPTTTDDTNLIEKLLTREDAVIARLPKTVTIRITTCGTEYAQMSVIDRWASFGWTARVLLEDVA